MASSMMILQKMSLVMLVLCLLISLDDDNNNKKRFNNNNNSDAIDPLDSLRSLTFSLSAKKNTVNYHSHSSSEKEEEKEVADSDSSDSESSLLEYDFYRDSCPHAERIVRATIHHFYQITPSLIPALIRLAFHDCFIQGCDASVLLDDDDYIDSEKESPPNGSLKGFDVIETIKSKLEEACPGIVSCADILVLAARDSVVLAGGPFYPLYTGRRDGSNSFADIATYELPSPYGDLSQTLTSFQSRGFDEREMVTLLGAHSIGVIHCKFFQDRLYNFSGTNEPDPTLNVEFLNVLRSGCNNDTDGSSSTSASEYSYHGSQPSYVAFNSTPLKGSTSSLLEEQQPGMTMDSSEQPLSDFGTPYYHSLLQGKGILYADQQLMEEEKTKYWVKEYASHPTLFHRDFALAMMKLSDLRVLTLPMGQIRLNCSKVA